MLADNRRQFLSRAAAAAGMGAFTMTAAAPWRRGWAAENAPSETPSQPTAAAAAGQQASWELLYTTQGKSSRIELNGGEPRYFDFLIPNQATWQPGPILPNGKGLIFLSMESRRDGEGKSFDKYYTQTPTHLWLYDLKTSDLRELCTKDRPAPFITPALLLGDDRLLIQVVRDGVGQIYSVNLDGSDPASSPCAGEGLPYGLSLSPDGQRVAFHLASPAGYQVWTSDLDGQDRRLVAADPAHLYFGTSWSPDGKSILFVDCHYHDDPGHDWADVCVGTEDGTPHRVLTKDQSMWFAATYWQSRNAWRRFESAGLDERRQDSSPSPLPDSKVAWEFQPQRPDVDHFNRDFKPELARGGRKSAASTRATARASRCLRNEPGVWDFRATESPDGRWIAFCRARTGEAPALWVMNSDGGAARRLTRGWEDRGADHPRWLARNTSSDS